MLALPCRTLTTKDACAILGVEGRSLGRWVSRGCPCNILTDSVGRGGRQYRFDLTELQRWQKTRRQGKHVAPVHHDDTQAGVIYALIDPRPENRGQVRYIGKCENAPLRERQYRTDLYRGTAHSPALRAWFAKLKTVEMQPIFHVLETCLFGLCTTEQEWITKGRAKGWPLLNIQGGGQGGRWSEGAKQRAREQTIARYRDPEYRQRFLDAQRKRFGTITVRRCNTYEATT